MLRVGIWDWSIGVLRIQWSLLRRLDGIKSWDKERLSMNAAGFLYRDNRTVEFLA